MLGQQHQDRYEPPPAPLWRRLVLPVLGVAFLVGAGLLVRTMLSHGPAPRPHTETHITNVKLPPPPPPPPPPKTPPPPTKTVEKKAQAVKTPKAPPKAPTPPAAAATSIKGNGPGSLAVGNNGGGDVLGGTGTGEGGDDDGYYRNLASSAIQRALESDDRVAHARFSGMASITFDRSGHVTSASLSNFDGDADLRAAVLAVLQRVSLRGELPQEMAGNPFNLRVSARPIRG